MRLATILVAALALGGCFSVGWEPVEKSSVVVAIVGFDEAMKDQFSTGAPSGDEDVRLSLVFQQDTKGCTPDGYNNSRAGNTAVAVFNQSVILDIASPDGEHMHVRIFNADSGWTTPHPLETGDYAFRDATLSWFGSQWNHVKATSEEDSLAFIHDGRPVFLGLYAISMNNRDELRLTEIPAPPDVLAAAAEQMGVSGMPDRADVRTRKLRRCGSTGGVRRVAG